MWQKIIANNEKDQHQVINDSLKVIFKSQIKTAEFLSPVFSQDLDIHKIELNI